MGSALHTNGRSVQTFAEFSGNRDFRTAEIKSNPILVAVMLFALFHSAMDCDFEVDACKYLDIISVVEPDIDFKFEVIDGTDTGRSGNNQKEVYAL